MNYLTPILIKLAHFIIWLIPSKLLVGFISILLLITKYRKQVINKNFKSTIGKSLSDNELGIFYKKCTHNIAKIIVETLKFNKSKTSKLKYSNISKLEQVCNSNNGLILMASHYGNWELACINLPIYTSLPCYCVYKPLKNKILDKELLRLRSRFGLKLIPMNSIARSIATNYKEATPAIYILIADQNPRSIHDVSWVDFLGVKSAFSKGMVKLQRKYNLPLAYMKTTPSKGVFGYDIDFEYPNDQQSENGVQWYSKRLECQIKEAPQFWLWSHKKWKRKYDPTIEQQN